MVRYLRERALQRYLNLRERWRQKYMLIVRRRKLRDFMDPFDVTYEQFVASYRLSQDVTMSLLELIRPHVRQTVSPLAIPLELKVSDTCSSSCYTFSHDSSPYCSC